MPPKIPKLFVSYRRADSADTAARLFDRLVFIFGRDNVFKDVDTLQRGDHFPDVLRGWVQSCDVCLVVIGVKWLTVQDQHGRRRLDDPADWVYQEVKMALERGKGCVVIPVLVDGASMMKVDALPSGLADLPARDAQTLRPSVLHTDITALTDSLQQRYGMQPKPSGIDLNHALRDAKDALRQKDLQGAGQIIAAMRAAGGIPAHMPLDALENTLYKLRKEEQRDAAYNNLCGVAELVEDGLMPFSELQPSLDAFWEIYPGHDPQNVARFQPAKKHSPPRKKAIDLLPKPFAWVKIPSGSVTLISEQGWGKNYIREGGSQLFHVPEFQIAKYSLTNAQFALFVAAKGYEQRQYWTEDGWEARLKGWVWESGKGWIESGQAWTQPRYWTDSQWNGADYPLVGVSFHEGVAYANWLSDLTGETISLPTEQQWQRAAQAKLDGSDGALVYVWGDTWKAGMCNNSVDKENSQQTTPVTAFENKGNVSPCGVVDMTGNVWEWCLTAYESGSQGVNGTDVRVLRGGSWFNSDSDGFRAAYRNGGDPHVSNCNLGMRFCLLS